MAREAGREQNVSARELDQAMLLPPTVNDWPPEGHLVYLFREAVRALDLSAFTTVCKSEERGF